MSYPYIPTGISSQVSGIPETNTEIAGEAVGVFNVVAFDQSGEVVLANATTALNRWEVAGAAQQAAAGGASVEVSMVSGQQLNLRFVAAPLSAENSSPVFLSAVSGQVSTTPPAVSGNTVYRVGTLLGADGITTTPLVLFNPQLVVQIP